MARIKSEVKEQQQALRQSQSNARSTPPKFTPPPPSAAACIDLTLDDTEDEEEADEPLGSLSTRANGSSTMPNATTVAVKAEKIQHATAASSSNGGSDQYEDMEIDPDDEEEDEDMPLPVARKSESVRSVVANMVGSALSYVMPSFRRHSSFDEADGGDLEEEEDEDLPVRDEAADSGDAGTATSAQSSVSDAGSGEGNTSASAVEEESLEDGEIFEEGAVVKSPTAVKQAIAEQLIQQAAKKKQKKRGRKRAKRKAADGSVAGSEDMEEGELPFPVPPPEAPSLMPPPPPPGSVQVPPAFMHAPPLPPPLPPASNFGAVPHNRYTFGDESIVRVHRPGFHQQPPPPFPPPPLAGGYRYVSLSSFGVNQPGPRGWTRGVKRPLSPPHRPEVREVNKPVSDEPVFDLDSLRAAALRTKKVTAAVDEAPVDSTRKSKDSSPSPPPETEEDASLDALRQAILASKKRRVDVPAKPLSTLPPAQPADTRELTDTAKNQASQPDTVRVSPAVAAVEKPQPTAPPDSPQRQPLTALTQSCVIRLSLDDLLDDHKKDRAYSYEDDARTISAMATVKAASTPATSDKRRLPVPPPSRVERTAPVQAVEPQRVKAEAQIARDESTSPVPTTGEKVGDEELLVDTARLEQEKVALREADTRIARLDADIAALRRLILEREAAPTAVAASTVAMCEV